MGQSERDRQRAEHREAERLYMTQRARESAEGQHRSTAHEGSPEDEAAGVKWGETLEGDCPRKARGQRRTVQRGPRKLNVLRYWLFFC